MLINTLIGLLCHSHLRREYFASEKVQDSRGRSSLRDKLSVGQVVSVADTICIPLANVSHPITEIIRSIKF